MGRRFEASEARAYANRRRSVELEGLPGLGEEPTDYIGYLVDKHGARVWDGVEACMGSLDSRYSACARYEHVEFALPETHLLLHLSELEAPRLDESEVVICPAADALVDRFCEAVFVSERVRSRRDQRSSARRRARDGPVLRIRSARRHGAVL
jgi:hypothetical protein